MPETLTPFETRIIGDAVVDFKNRPAARSGMGLHASDKADSPRYEAGLKRFILAELKNRYDNNWPAHEMKTLAGNLCAAGLDSKAELSQYTR